MNYLNLIGLILNTIGTILLAFSTQIIDPLKDKGVSFKIVGLDYKITSINKRRFIWGIVILLSGFILQLIGLFV